MIKGISDHREGKDDVITRYGWVLSRSTQGGLHVGRRVCLQWEETWVWLTRVRRRNWVEGWWWWRWKREYEAGGFISLCVATQKQTREGGCVLHNISTYTIKYCFRVSCVSTSWNNTLLMAGLSDVRTYNRPGTQAKVFYLRVASPLGVLTV